MGKSKPVEPSRMPALSRSVPTLAAMCVLLFAACAKENVFQEPPDRPVIDSIAPASGKIGTQIRLFGTGFSYSATRNVVKVNGTQVRVDSPSSSTVVLATITRVTGTGHVQITVDSQHAEGPIFTYDENAVSLNSLTPSVGWVDTLVTIRGAGFGTNPDSVTVDFGGHPASIQKLSDTLILAVAPDALNQSAGTVSVTVMANGRKSNALGYTYAAKPQISNVTVAGRPALHIAGGDTAIITGLHFGTLQPGAVVEIWFNHTDILHLGPDPAILSWSDSQVRIVVPTYNEPDGTILQLFIKQGSQSGEADVTYLVAVATAGGLFALGITAAHTWAYWRNGTINSIPAAYNIKSMFVDGSDLYLAGEGTDPASGTIKGGVWKNGTAAFQGDATAANDIFVTGGDVYIAGAGLSTSHLHSVAVYWKNGVRADLTDGTVDAVATGIFVSGTDIYVSGTVKNPSTGNDALLYWKNGVPTVCTDGSKAFYINAGTSMTVSANDVYIAGSLVQSTSFPNIINQFAAYWQSGSEVNVSTVPGYATGQSVWVDGPDVYIGGQVYKVFGAQTFRIAAFWKNGIETDLTDSAEKSGLVNSIVVSGTDVYAGGTEQQSPELGGYWKNGVFNALPSCITVTKLVVR